MKNKLHFPRAVSVSDPYSCSLYFTCSAKEKRFKRFFMPIIEDSIYSEEIVPLDKPNRYGITDYPIGARFKIIGRSRSKSHIEYRTIGSGTRLSLHTMVAGSNNMDSFNSYGAEIYFGLEVFPEKNILYLPEDYDSASRYVERNLIGKTLRVIARSPSNATRFHTRYYLFLVEDL